MTTLEATLRHISADLQRHHASFALVGGLAVSVRTEPRFTRDADLAVALEADDQAEALIHDLRASGYGIEAVVEQEAVGRLATVRLTLSSRPQAPVVDLLFASSGIEPEVVAAAEPIEALPSLRIDVAQVGHLIALKVLSRAGRRDAPAGHRGSSGTPPDRIACGADAGARVARSHCRAWVQPRALAPFGLRCPACLTRS